MILMIMAEPNRTEPNRTEQDGRSCMAGDELAKKALPAERRAGS
jgi:hypothetical protein